MTWYNLFDNIFDPSFNNLPYVLSSMQRSLLLFESAIKTEATKRMYLYQLKKFLEWAKVYADNPVAYALRQSNMLYESIKVQGSTIVMIPSESLNSMGFGNLGTTIAYLESTKNAVAKQKSKDDKTKQKDVGTQ